MKLFWSWQADTPGNISGYFARDALSEAIEVLKTDEDIVEPSEREARDALRLDADRQGVPGSPDLAATIFDRSRRQQSLSPMSRWSARRPMAKS
jgi:hypothetical protein